MAHHAQLVESSEVKLMAFNMGDANAVWKDMDVLSDHPAEKPVHGKIHTYVSDLNPSEIDISQPSFVTKVEVFIVPL